MTLRTRSAHKITPTAARKRPNVRLCGGGSNRPDRGNKNLAPQGPVRAGKGHSIFFDIFLIFKLLYRRIHAYIYAGSDINAKAERSAMKSPILYFAYGSNMNPLRMGHRCPGATALGVGVLRNYQIAERLYADIDFQEGGEVHGVLFLITDQHLRSLDAREGYPKVYRRMWLPVEFSGESYLAVTYEMTAATKAARSGKRYPEEYRKIYSEGARFYRVKNNFTTRRKRA